MPEDKQGEEEDIDVERLVLGLRATAKADAEVVVPPLDIAPLSASERSDIVAAILSAPTATRTTREISGVTSLAAARRRRSRWVAIAAPVAVAAGLALGLGLPARRNPAFPALPAYDVSALGGLKEVRGGGSVPTPSATAPTERVARDTELTIGLRPATAVDGALAVRAFLVAGVGVAGVGVAGVGVARGSGPPRRSSAPASTSPGRARRRFTCAPAPQHPRGAPRCACWWVAPTTSARPRPRTPRGRPPTAADAAGSRSR